MNKYSIVTVIELGLPVSESSTRTSKLYALTDSERKFHKTGLENWLDSIWNSFDWEPAAVTSTLWSTTNGES